MAFDWRNITFCILTGCGFALCTVPSFAQTPSHSEQLTQSQDDTVDACLKNASEDDRVSCLSAVVTHLEDDVQRAYNDALRVQLGRQEEYRTKANDLTITEDSSTFLIESQTAWQQDYQEKCNTTETQATDRILCQYDLLQARLKDLQQMN